MIGGTREGTREEEDGIIIGNDGYCGADGDVIVTV